MSASTATLMPPDYPRRAHDPFAVECWGRYWPPNSPQRWTARFGGRAGQGWPGGLGCGGGGGGGGGVGGGGWVEGGGGGGGQVIWADGEQGRGARLWVRQH